MDALGPRGDFSASPKSGRVKSLSSLDLKISRLSLEVLSASEGGSSSSAFSSGRRTPFSATPHFDLDRLALPEGEGFGYKSANLLRLQEVARRLHVQVPGIMPLSHHILIAHIFRSYPDFRKDYQRFLDLLGDPPELHQEAILLSKVIQEKIKNAFLQENIFASDFLIDWLSRCSSEFIAVRSTGKEDSDTNSNAGGNLSNPFVSKDPLDISKNIGEVIASYFSEKSISQRIASKDPSLLTDREPFVPVLLQEAVGEPISGITERGLIPRSGVMFVKKDISELSVGYGHNEGIVSSEVRTDCYRFGFAGKIQQVVQNKPTRFRGSREFDGGVSAGPVRMERDLAKSPALEERILERMQRLAGELYRLYEKEMDVEFTIIGDQIFLLQARPLNTLTPTLPPSYLTDVEEEISCESLTSGGCFVRRVESEEEVVVCKTIKDAYLLYKERGEGVKAVVIEETAPRTGHEAVFFTGIGIPVLVSHEEFQLRPPYLIDPQQGIIARSGRVEEGYICYPIPLQYSMKASPLVEEMHRYTYEPHPSRKKEIDIALSELRGRIGPRLGSPIRSMRELQECLQIIKSGDKHEVQVALSQIKYCVASKAFQRDITSKNRIELIMILENLLDISEGEYFIEEPMSMYRLYGARLIEACLFQTGNEIIGGSSYMRVLTDIRNEEKGVEELLGYKDPYLSLHVREKVVEDVLFIKVGRGLLKLELQERWKKALTYLPSLLEERKQRIQSLFLLIDKIGDSMEFMNVTLGKLLLEFSHDPDLFFTQLEELSFQLLPTLEKALELKNFSEDLKANIGAFSNSKNIRKGLPRILARLKKIGLTTGAFSIVHRYKMTSSEERLILIQALREVVTSFDHLIKACTGSREYTSDLVHAADFLALIRPYREMMWVVKKMSKAPLRDTFDLSNYELPSNLEALGEEEAKALRDVSPGFDVTKIVASETVYYTLEKPVPAVTLEEKFTLFHQTMEHHLSMMAVANGFSTEMLPIELQTYLLDVKQGDFLLNKQLISIKMEEGKITVNFSVPLRDHAANLTFFYNLESNRLDVKLLMLGGNEWNRWGKIRELGYELNKELGIDIDVGNESETGCKLIFRNLTLDGLWSGKVIGKMIAGLIQSSFAPFVNILQLVEPKMQTEELVLKMIRLDPWHLKDVAEEALTPSILKEALQLSPYAIEFIPYHLQTEEMALQLVQQNGNLLEFINPELISDVVLLEALKNEPMALKFVPDEKQNLSICFDAVVRRADALEFVREDLKIPRLVDVALEKNLEAFRFIPQELQNPKLVAVAVKRHPLLFGSVRRDLITQELSNFAVQKIPYLIRYVPFEFQSSKMVLEVVHKNGGLLEFVDPNLMSRKVIQTALANTPDALEFIPGHLRIPQMLDPEFQRGTLRKIFDGLGAMFSMLRR